MTNREPKKKPHKKEPPKPADTKRTIERIQTGVRMERRLLSVLKAMADLHSITLGDLLEGIVLHVFEGKLPFSAPSIEKIQALKEVFGLNLDASDSHLLVEESSSQKRKKKEVL